MSGSRGGSRPWECPSSRNPRTPREGARMIVAIGGPPGSGKTTVAERFAQAHAYALVSAGLKFRQMAKDRGLDLEAFGKAAEADPDIDRSLDHAVLEEILRQDSLGRDVIVDGRIQ